MTDASEALHAPAARTRPRRTAFRRLADHFDAHPWPLRVVSIAVVLGLWEWAGRIPVSIAFPTFSATGVGDLITYYSSLAMYPHMFASILSIVIIASVSVTLLQSLEERIFRPEMRPS